MDKKKITLTTMLAVVAINNTVKAQQAGSIQVQHLQTCFFHGGDFIQPKGGKRQ